MTIPTATGELSKAGKCRMLANWGEPLFLAAWARAVFIHYEADPSLLQRQIPFPLDLRGDRAFVSIVAFTLQKMRPRIGGRVTELLFRPIASHEFLNVRTYVRHAGEPGIFFLAEWLSNPLSVRLGPRTFGLPYRFGHLRYSHIHEEGEILGRVAANEGKLEYRARLPGTRFEPSEEGSETEFLLERYTAFTCQHRRQRLFRVWHEAWKQTPIEIQIIADDLLSSTGEWWNRAEFVSANYSPGVDVWMGRPHRVSNFLLRESTEVRPPRI